MGLPAAAVPVGRTPDGLPIGVQVIGRRYREMEVLAVAKELEEALGGWIKPDLAQVAGAHLTTRSSERLTVGVACQLGGH